MLSKLDHLVYTASSLEQGMDEIERLLGLRPVFAGKHPDFGTHNALLSLGPRCFLEVISPDPGLPAPPHGRLLENMYAGISRLSTWVLTTDEIENLVEKAQEQGLGIGEVQMGRREKTDGSMLTWKLSDPYAMPMGGALPFLISWGESPHPGGSFPKVGELMGFHIVHPEAEAVRKGLEVLGVDFKVKKGDEFHLIATISCRRGVVELS